MRVIECDECGETLQAAGDDELKRALGRHLSDEHELEVDDDDLTELVEAEAYEAMDS